MADAYSKAREKSTETAERTRAFLEDAKRHLGEARDGIGRVASKGRHQAEVLYAKSREQYEALSARARETYDKIKVRVAEVDFKEKGDQVLSYIRDNPGKSVLIALAVGFLVGYVSRPRD
jgi:ElaB/YqjD/DUF883 family membrane-anchored ribosome-binding protein